MVREMKHTEIGEIPAEWELQTFEETFRILSNNTLPRAEMNNRGGIVRNVHYGDILTRFGEVLNCEKDEIPYLNDVSPLTASAQVLQDGDVILADTAEDDTVGKATEVYGLGKGRMVAGLHTIPCRVKKGDFVPKWLGYYMNSPLYHDQVLPYVTGIKVSSISKTAISETLIAVPPIEEQKAIASALSEVDQLLVELKKVVSKLRDFKRGCLYLMFPQEGADIPQMREPGYTEPWEQRKLEKTLYSLQNNTLSKAELSTEYGVARNVHYGDILVKFREILDLRVETLPMITDEDIVSKYRASFLQEGDIVVADTAEDETVGKCSEIIGLSGETVVAGLHTIPYRPLFYFAPGYLGYYMNSPAYHQQLLPLMQGIKVTSISKFAMQNTIIAYPKSEDEQAKIGAYFCNLDHLITLHQQKFDKYAQIKKAMMSELITGKIKLV